MGEETKESCGGDGIVKEEQQKEMRSDNENIIIRVDMHCHCQACAKKIIRALRASQGVEDVAVDRNTNLVEIKGKTAEPPLKLCDIIRQKTGRQAHLLSPLPKPPLQQPDEDNSIHHHQQLHHNSHQPPPAVRTVVVLGVHMHCEACAQLLRKHIRKMEGVETVETDVSKDEVIVKGEIGDPEKVVKYVQKRTKKQVLLVKSDEIKAEDTISEQGQVRKEDNIENSSSREAAAGINNNITDHDDKVMMMVGNMNRQAHYNYWPSPRSYDYMDYHHHHHHHSINYQPPIFSDENPNACSIM